MAEIRKNYDAGCAPDGTRWPDILESTKRHKHSSRVGIDTGRQRNLLNTGTYDIADDSATWRLEGSPADYAKAKGFGEFRPFLGWSPEAKGRALAMLEAEKKK